MASEPAGKWRTGSSRSDLNCLPLPPCLDALAHIAALALGIVDQHVCEKHCRQRCLIKGGIQRGCPVKQGLRIATYCAFPPFASMP